MSNSADAIKQFVSLRDSIVAEREELLARLRAIDDAIGSTGFQGAGGYYGSRTASASGPRNELSLKEAILLVIKGQALTKHEILDAVLKAGYTFRTDDPLNSMGVVLYGKSPKFKNQHGRFSLS